MNISTSPWTNCLEGGVAKLSCLTYALQNIVNFAVGFAGALAVILIIYAGVKFIISGGDKEKVEQAKKTLTFAIYGLLFIIFSFFIIFVISQLTGVPTDQLFKLPFG